MAPPGARAILLVALAAHLLQWVAPPTLSDDLYRYLWDGRVQSAGISPFLHPPDDAALEPLRDPLWRAVNHKSIRTIYPPLAQLLFRGVDKLWHSPWAMKAISGLFSLGIVMLLLVGGGNSGRRAALLYGWCPLAASESAGNGHVDSVALFWTLAGALLAQRPGARAIAASAATAAAIATKMLGVLLLPALARRQGWRAAVAALALTALCYLPFAGAGARLFEGLSVYATTWRFNGALHPLLALAAGEAAARWLLVAALVLGAAIVWARRVPPVAAAAALLALLILGSPVVHPWYVLWLLPFAALAGWAWPFVLATTVPVAYEVLHGCAAGGPWRPAAWAPWAVYLPVLACALWEWRRSARGRPSSGRRLVKPT